MTGAGKTHTMQGTTDAPGIIPRVANRIMELAETIQKPTEVFVSYLEIYNERVYDLLEPKTSEDQDLPIRWSNGEIMIPGLTVKKMTSFQMFDQIYKKACKNRTVASNGVNIQSSRSHAILSVNVRVTDDVKITCGKINLIDLAGSEDNRYTDNRGSFFFRRIFSSKNFLFRIYLT
jgi:kinesin family member 22